jgi:hypothetical protein
MGAAPRYPATSCSALRQIAAHGVGATDEATPRTQGRQLRLEGMGRFAQHPRETGVLRPGMSVDEARDVLWTLNSHEVHQMLVGKRGWSQKRYRNWLAQMLASALLGD